MIKGRLKELNRRKKIAQIDSDKIARFYEFECEDGNPLPYFPGCRKDEETGLYIMPDGRYVPNGAYYDRETKAKIICESWELSEREYELGILDETIEYYDKLEQEKQDR